MDPRNTHGKIFWTDEVVTRKNFRPTKNPQEKVSKFLREKIRNPLNTNKKNPYRPTKYAQEKILDLQNTPADTIARWHWTHETHDGTQPTKLIK